MSLRSKCLIDSGGSFRCLCDIFLGVFLKAASFQKTLAGEEGLFIASQDWDKNHIFTGKPNLAHCFNLEHKLQSEVNYIVIYIYHLQLGTFS